MTLLHNIHYATFSFSICLISLSIAMSINDSLLSIFSFLHAIIMFFLGKVLSPALILFTVFGSVSIFMATCLSDGSSKFLFISFNSSLLLMFETSFFCVVILCIVF